MQWKLQERVTTQLFVICRQHVFKTAPPSPPVFAALSSTPHTSSPLCKVFSSFPPDPRQDEEKSQIHPPVTEHRQVLTFFLLRVE